MRHLRMLNEETESGLAAAVLSGDLEDLVEGLGDDWSLEDAEELDLALDTLH